MPLLANTVTGLLYPLHWPVFLFEKPADGLAWVAYLGFAIAGLLMLGFLRALGLGPTAAAFGAIAFMLSGTLYANAHFYMRLSALVWTPGMLWAVLRASERDGWARVPALVGLAFCVGMTWLAGFPSYSAPATLVAGLYAATRCVQMLRERGGGDALRLGAMLGAAVAVGFGIAAVQLSPMFAFFPESNRPLHTAPDDLAIRGFDPAGMLGYLLPSVFGHPHLSPQPYGESPLTTYLFTRGHWEAGPNGKVGEYFFPTNYNFVEYTVFPGTLALLLAAGRRAVSGPGLSPGGARRPRTAARAVVRAELARRHPLAAGGLRRAATAVPRTGERAGRDSRRDGPATVLAAVERALDRSVARRGGSVRHLLRLLRMGCRA